MLNGPNHMSSSDEGEIVFDSTSPSSNASSSASASSNSDPVIHRPHEWLTRLLTLGQHQHQNNDNDVREDATVATAATPLQDPEQARLSSRESDDDDDLLEDERAHLTGTGDARRNNKSVTFGPTEQVEIQRPSGAYRVIRSPDDVGPSASERAKIEKRLPEDTFSLTMIAQNNSLGFWYGVGTSVFQFTTYIVVLSDVIDVTNTGNPFNFPANVDIPVRIAEMIALIILIPLQDEILEALILINDGYQSEALETKFHFTSRYKFLLSLILRLVVGFLSVFTSFILIMVESSVLEIFFNFIALQFINDLDNLAFKLGMEGICGQKIQAPCRRVSDTSYYTEGRFNRRLPLFGIFLVVIAGWTWILVLQRKGQFVSESIEVQFSDLIDPALSTFSGLYDRESNPSESGRFRYMERTSQMANFAYCVDEEAWTFSYQDVGNPCSNYAAISEKTNSYEITDSVLWQVVNSFDRQVPMDPFYLECFVCSGGNSNPCQAGTYNSDTKMCDCPPGKFGRRCEFIEPCEVITMETLPDSTFYVPRDFPLKYNVIRNENGKAVAFYGKPVYAATQVGLVTMFNGRRWFFTDVQAFGLDPRETDDLALARFVETSNWHLHYSPVISTFVSGPSDIGSSSESAIPAYLDWYRALYTTPGPQRPKLDEKQPVYFDCDACHPTLFPCLYGNPCVEGKCQCIDGSSGARCNIIPSENGHCDPAFNRYEFALDRGDCCQASCRSTTEFVCGYEDRVEVGFPLCIDPAFSCPPNQPCWNLMVAEHDLPRPTGTSSTRNGTVVKGAPNGRIVVVGQPALDQVQVLDLHDTWKERVTTAGTTRGGRFGAAVAVSTLVAGGSILDFVSSPVDIRVAISEYQNTINGLRASISIHDWRIDKFDLVGPALSLVGPGSDERAPFFDFFAQGRYIAAQAETDTIGIFDTRQDNTMVASIDCVQELGSVCVIHGVSEEGSMVLADSMGNVYQFEGFDAVNATVTDWSAIQVPTTTNPIWIILSRDGRTLLVASATSSTALAIQFYMLVGNSAWIELGSSIPTDSFTSVATISRDGLTAAFVFCDDNGANTCSIHSYRYNSEIQDFSPMGNTIPVAASPSISLSDDGSELIVTDSSGLLQTFEYGPRCSKETESYIRVFLVLEPKQAVSWNLSYEGSSESDATTTIDSPEYPEGYPLKILEHICVPRTAQCTYWRITPSFPFADLGATDGGDSFVSIIADREEVVNALIPGEATTFSWGRACSDNPTP